MYKVLKVWPSFEHFNSTRQMASPVVVYTVLLGGMEAVSGNCNEWQNDNIDEGFQIL